jgi:hypothetical protein
MRESSADESQQLRCAGELARSWDLSAFGPVQALTAGPYGTLLALTWDPASQSAMLVHLDTTPDADAGASDSCLLMRPFRTFDTAADAELQMHGHNVWSGKKLLACASWTETMPERSPTCRPAGPPCSSLVLCYVLVSQSKPGAWLCHRTMRLTQQSASAIPARLRRAGLLGAGRREAHTSSQTLNQILPSPPGSGVLDSWELAGVHSPHDVALSAAPIGATVGGSRSLAVYVAEAARGGRASRLHKLIVHHPSASAPFVCSCAVPCIPCCCMSNQWQSRLSQPDGTELPSHVLKRGSSPHDTHTTACMWQCSSTHQCTTKCCDQGAR